MVLNSLLCYKSVILYQLSYEVLFLAVLTRLELATTHRDRVVF